jgi:phage baseplate assembly protein gpV
VGTAILEKLSQSPTFLALASRMSAAEAGKAPLASPVFTGTVTCSNDLLQPNATYIKGTLNGGATTRLFGLNSSNALYIGGIDQTISSIQFEVAQTPVATLASGGLTMAAGSQLSASNFSAANALIGDANFGLNFNSGAQPFVAFDNGDNFSYIRSSNMFVWNIANTVVLSATASNVAFAGSATFYDSQFSMLQSGGTPLLNFDTGDYLRYDRTGNAFGWLIASTVQMTLGTDGLHVANNIYSGDNNFGAFFSGGVQPYYSFDAGDSFSYIRATNIFQWVVGGSSLMQLDSAGKLTVGDTNFGAVFNGGTQPFIAFDSGDYLQYTRANNTLTFNVAGSAVVTMSAAGGGTLSVGDGNNAWGINGGMPTLQFDVGDYLQYDRAANKFNFFVGGTKVASIDGSGNMRLLGTLTQSTTP